MIICKCSLCEESKECLQKEIDGKEYDICGECWNALNGRLRGKGRAIKHRESVSLPPPEVRKEEESEKPFPGKPPKIWYSSDSSQ
jgi:ATP-dependent protease Clp ATPase subunit